MEEMGKVPINTKPKVGKRLLKRKETSQPGIFLWENRTVSGKKMSQGSGEGGCGEYQEIQKGEKRVVLKIAQKKRKKGNNNVVEHG